ncbi:MAG: GNAT family N-acetyltransferase [Maricaulaceae bacterium]
MTDLANYLPRDVPGRRALIGRYVRLEPINWVMHGPELAPHYLGPQNDDLWAYMHVGPFADIAACQEALEQSAAKGGWEMLAIISQQSGKALGCASFMRLRRDVGSVEVGFVAFGHALQRTHMATEAMFLMADHAIADLGYRRYEWKCEDANGPSKRAAARLGFQYEGLFRQDRIVKGRNRDTAWFSILDSEWPALKREYQRWLSEDNFAPDGQQKTPLKARDV